MDNTVTLTHRNVCKDGFTVTDTVDAGTHRSSLPVFELTVRVPVFLDLPAPWEAVPHAKVALRVNLINLFRELNLF